MRTRSARGTVLLLVILCLAILTVVGIALKFSTGFERASAANEWSINRAFYAADAGIRWTTAQAAAAPEVFLGRPEFLRRRDVPDACPRSRNGRPFLGRPGRGGNPGRRGGAELPRTPALAR